MKHPCSQFKSRRVLVVVFFIIALCASYAFGVYSYPRGIWPISAFRAIKSSMLSDASGAIAYDGLGRVEVMRRKIQIDCPEQTSDTAVLLAIGQSNAANHAEKKVVTRYPDKVLNYYNGKCYVASSPLLGATGDEGEFITLLGDYLVDSKTFNSIVIISSGVTGTSIERWRNGGDLNRVLLPMLEQLQRQYKITDILWYQGESDFFAGTSTKNYVNSFHSLKDSMATIGIDAPIFMATTTICGSDPSWRVENSIAEAQKILAEDDGKIIVAINADILLGATDRRPDQCHLSESGQTKIAKAFAVSMKKYHDEK